MPCVPAWIHGQPLGGIQALGTLKILTHDQDMSFEYLLALSFRTCSILFCAAWAKWPAAVSCVLGGSVPKRRSTITPGIIMNAIVVACFNLTLLLTQVNKVLLFWGALHNWAEWNLLGNVYIGFFGAFGGLGVGLEGIARFNKLITLGISAQILGIMLIDDVGCSFIWEEFWGMWADLQLVLVSLYCWRAARGDSVAGSIMAKFALAAVCHTVTVISLKLMAYLVILDWPIGMPLCIASVMSSLALYTMFALSLDAWLSDRAVSNDSVAWAPLNLGNDPPKDAMRTGATNRIDALVPAGVPGLPELSSLAVVTFMLGVLILCVCFVFLPILLDVYCAPASV